MQRLHKGIQTDTPTSCTPDPCLELESEEADDTQIDQQQMAPQVYCKIKFMSWSQLYRTVLKATIFEPWIFLSMNM